MSYLRTDRPGLGSYSRVPNWAWEFYPPPYNFLAPAPVRGPRGQVAPEEAALVSSGFSGCGGSCGCGGTCGSALRNIRGVGQGLLNTGLFESGDMSTWGWGEYLVIAGGIYLVGSLFGDAKKVGRKSSKAARVFVAS